MGSRNQFPANHRSLWPVQEAESSFQKGRFDRCSSVREIASRLRNRDQRAIRSTYGPSMNPKLSSAHGDANKRHNKRALLCGITYTNKRKYRLRGTVNDVKDMRDLLINRYQYPSHCIRVLTEFEPDKEFHPTKKNIESSLRWLVDGCQAGDHLVFYFSGHGLRQPDFNNDELDGFDETICPVDFVENGMISDNYINVTIVRPLKDGVILHAIVDACHSGTILDLEYVYYQNSKMWTSNKPPSGARKSTSGGLAICLSACEDSQIAADTTVFTGKEMYGALTYVFIEVIRQNPDVTYAELLEQLSATFGAKSTNQVKCLNSRTLARLFGYKIVQRPLLSSSSDRFNINSKIIL